MCRLDMEVLNHVNVSRETMEVEMWKVIVRGVDKILLIEIKRGFKSEVEAQDWINDCKKYFPDLYYRILPQ